MSSHTHLNEWDLKTSECYITFSIDICRESLWLHENEAKSKRRQLTSNEWDWIGLSYVISGAQRMAILSRDGWCGWQVCMGLDKEGKLSQRQKQKGMTLLLQSYPLKTNLSLIPYSKEVEMSQLRALLEVLLSSCNDTALCRRKQASLALQVILFGWKRKLWPYSHAISPVLSQMVLARRCLCGRETLHILFAHLFKSQPQTDPVPNFQECLPSVCACNIWLHIPISVF